MSFGLLCEYISMLIIFYLLKRKSKTLLKSLILKEKLQKKVIIIESNGDLLAKILKLLVFAINLIRS